MNQWPATHPGLVLETVLVLRLSIQAAHEVKALGKLGHVCRVVLNIQPRPPDPERLALVIPLELLQRKEGRSTRFSEFSQRASNNAESFGGHSRENYEHSRVLGGGSYSAI